MDWLICSPVWGGRCEKAFLSTTVPCLKAAIAEGVSGKVRFVIHTHDRLPLSRALSGFDVQFLPVPHHKLSEHHSAGVANREALKLARPGEAVAFVNADMACSVELFKSAEARFAEGKRMIVMAASRTIGGQPDPGMKSRDLLRWTMEHKHPSIVQCFWGSGRTTMPWAIYFQKGEDIVLRGFHLHPFAVLNDRELGFEGYSIDRDLAEIFKKHEIHLITDPDEGAFAEMSPPERLFGTRIDFMTTDGVARWARSPKRTNAMHRWFFEQPITICGNGGDIGDAAICKEILRKLG